MVAKLDTKAKTGYQINNKDCIHFDWVGAHHFIEHPHYADQLKENHQHTNSDDHSNTQTAQNLKGKDNSGNTQQSILGQDSSDVGILIIENVKQRIGEGGWCLCFSCTKEIFQA